MRPPEIPRILPIGEQYLQGTVPSGYSSSHTSSTNPQTQQCEDRSEGHGTATGIALLVEAQSVVEEKRNGVECPLVLSISRNSRGNHTHLSDGARAEYDCEGRVPTESALDSLHLSFSWKEPG